MQCLGFISFDADRDPNPRFALKKIYTDPNSYLAI